MNLSSPAAAAVACLSPREREVFLAIIDGLSSREIAERAGISVRTAEAHRARVMRKLGAQGAVQLARWAIRHGIIEP